MSHLENGLETAPPRQRSGALRSELSARNVARAQAFEHEATCGDTPSVIYAENECGLHGNFFPSSYRRIVRNPAWRDRLEKAYTASRSLPYAERRQRRELDCAASSDALLMSIFCHPTVLRSARLCALLGVDAGTPPHFGVRARVPLRGGYDDRTEIDMILSSKSAAEESLFVEAKLSESDFQSARPDLLARYPTFDESFDAALLSRHRGHFRSYQLLRNVLAAQHHNARFAVMLDARRTDLLTETYLVYRAVRDATLRSRLHVVTWQEIALCVGRPMQRFLAEKYGIHPA